MSQQFAVEQINSKIGKRDQSPIGRVKPIPGGTVKRNAINRPKQRALSLFYHYLESPITYHYLESPNSSEIAEFEFTESNQSNLIKSLNSTNVTKLPWIRSAGHFSFCKSLSLAIFQKKMKNGFRCV